MFVSGYFTNAMLAYNLHTHTLMARSVFDRMDESSTLTQPHEPAKNANEIAEISQPEFLRYYISLQHAKETQNMPYIVDLTTHNGCISLCRKGFNLNQIRCMQNAANSAPNHRQMDIWKLVLKVFMFQADWRSKMISLHAKMIQWKLRNT